MLWRSEPGSYTGLRVGLGVAKGLALAYQTPLIGVPTLDIVAAQFGEMPDELLIIAEAGRTRILAGRYQWQKRGWQTETPPEIFTWEGLLESLNGRSILAGEISADANKLIRNSGKQVSVVAPAAQVRRAGYLAEIGWQRLRKKQFDDPVTLTPNYLRDPAGA